MSDITMTRKAYERGLFALHQLHVSLFRALLPRLAGPWDEMLTQRDEAKPYVRHLHSILYQSVRVRPELVELLETDEGVRKFTELLIPVFAGTVASRLGSDPDLQLMQGAAERAFQELNQAVTDLEGDGQPALGHELEVDLETLVKEPSRLHKALPLGTLGLGEREREELAEALGADLKSRDEYAQTILPHLLQVATAPRIR